MMPQPPLLRVTQTLIVALAVGVLGFTTAAVVVRLSGKVPESPDVARILPLVMLALALAEIPVFVLLRRVFVARAAEEREASLAHLREGRIPFPFHTLSIVGAALAESIGVLGLVAVFLGANWFVLVGPALSVVLILLQVPTRGRLERLVRGL